ncbi:hypothetical protein CcrC1_gp503 [Caulobacter phage C1]|nr:hypothetical protein CcrC1_gp010 [Caulobacter phage C1]UTU08238.1 hypothetical protein CcrC2_gp010 [Caulobacter phage C2]UTU08761.1 hypothetical protein CcrJ4_gp010 [Caulobacter phage J4]UTU09297.1 hypothetical protein CcrBL47_gp011 [Caulobacter phage BL47]UTU09873.1 hypothetical protein CcrRB23_gp011 [Caulobacter phage RB23]WGN96897.1 hypothetical protein [Bertelyvirus sp.]
MTDKTTDLLYPQTLLAQNLPGRPGMLPAWIVLRDMGPKSHHRYVTHMRLEYPAIDEAGPKYGFDHGHYFADLREAIEDYSQRCADKVMSAMRQAYDVPRAPDKPRTVTLPLGVVQAAYGLIDGNTFDLNAATEDKDLVNATEEALREALGSDRFFRDVEAASKALADAYRAANQPPAEETAHG